MMKGKLDYSKGFTQPYRDRAGFTLIELLVVIAIIGILAALVTATISDARSKSRNSAMVSNVKEFMTALELYYNDNNEYPDTNGWACIGDYGDGRCWANDSAHDVESGFNTAMEPYFDVDGVSMLEGPYEGAMYADRTSVSGINRQGYEIIYMLEKEDQTCPIGLLRNADAWGNNTERTTCTICENYTHSTNCP